ncbi:hypothetical protein BKA81DRAFT_79344 [Phyllosticta paracitricarpa]|uniref:Secreted protein n=1 Tax=Phyllosticta citricarpa TaxID=55181 RepID=A0ABR1M410_9PEZI
MQGRCGKRSPHTWRRHGILMAFFFFSFSQPTQQKPSAPYYTSSSSAWACYAGTLRSAPGTVDQNSIDLSAKTAQKGEAAGQQRGNKKCWAHRHLTGRSAGGVAVVMQKEVGAVPGLSCHDVR